VSTDGLERVGKDPLTKTVAKKAVEFVAQLTPTDCGAASLASVLAMFGKHVPIHEVRNVLGGGRNGVTAKQLLAAARHFGLSARAVQIEPNKLKYLPPASILHWNLAHFVVYQKSNAKLVEIMDPAIGKRRVPMQEAAKALSGVALVFEPSQGFVPEAPRRRVRFKRYAAWMFSVRKVWGRILATSFFLQILALSGPSLMTVLVDKVVPRGDKQLLYLLAAGFLMIASFSFLSSLLRSRLLLELRTKVEARMSFDFLEHLVSLPYAFFQQRTTGDLMMRMSSQIAIRELLTSGALSALLDGVLVCLYFVLLMGAAPVLALVALGIAALQVLLYLVASRRTGQLMIESLAAQSRLEAYQVEMLAGIEALKSMGATDRSLARWSDLYVNTLNRSIAKERLDGSFGTLLGTLRILGPVCLMLTGAYKVLEGSLSLGVMLGLAALGSGFLDPIANLVGTGMKLSQLRGYMERIEDVLETPPEARRKPSNPERNVPAPLAGSIRVSDLFFKYPSEPTYTLQHLTFVAEPGECVAIVGPSGSGKSTLARLLAGLYEPASGSIAFDGRDMRTWDLHALRERLGIVTQDTRLFSGTIRDNVSLFDPMIPIEEVEAACRKACLDEAIQQMPMGYDTMLADGGSSLSGGQRQRLSLARALVRKPSVLILDEATSALDAITERAVQENLRALRCTRIIVAHRLSTVVEADKIMVLERGKLVGVGRHAELMTQCATYRDLVHSQSEAAGSSTLLAADRESSVGPAGQAREAFGLAATLASRSARMAEMTQVFGAASASSGSMQSAPAAAPGKAGVTQVFGAGPLGSMPSAPGLISSKAGVTQVFGAASLAMPSAPGAVASKAGVTQVFGAASLAMPSAPGVVASKAGVTQVLGVASVGSMPSAAGLVPSKAGVTQVFGAAPVASLPGARAVVPSAQLSAASSPPIAPADSAARARPPTQTYADKAEAARAPGQRAPAPGPSAGMAGDPKRNTSAAADDGTFVKWGKPTSGS
jgi:ATP-binding cassette, subfamily B, bacterial